VKGKALPSPILACGCYPLKGKALPRPILACGCYPLKGEALPFNGNYLPTARTELIQPIP